jgi:hypothetical protein
MSRKPNETVILYTIGQAYKWAKQNGWPVSRRKIEKAIALGHLHVYKDAYSVDNYRHQLRYIEHSSLVTWLNNVAFVVHNPSLFMPLTKQAKGHK